QPPTVLPGSLSHALWLEFFYPGEPLEQQTSSATLLLVRTSVTSATPPAGPGRYMLSEDPTMDAKDVFSDSGSPAAAVPWEDLYYEDKWDIGCDSGLANNNGSGSLASAGALGGTGVGRVDPRPSSMAARDFPPQLLLVGRGSTGAVAVTLFVWLASRAPLVVDTSSGSGTSGAIVPWSSGPASLAKSNGDLSIVEGTPDESVAAAGSSTSTTRVAVMVSRGTSWAARGGLQFSLL
nr:hypothetical protein [Tanacetum cinerariifolium]